MRPPAPMHGLEGGGDPRLTVVVPTCDRAQLLPTTLRSLAGQDLEPAGFEILVIENGATGASEAATREALASARCSWRWLREPRPGLHHARNRGLIEARGEIVAFGDDDVVADGAWLSSLLREFDRDPGVGVVGGCVRPTWEVSPPAWVFDYGDERAHTTLALLDRGERREELAHAHVIGCNFAIRRELALRVGGSPPDTFPDRLRELSGTGESSLIDRAREQGQRVVYLPEAVVSHRVTAARMTLRYFVARHRRWVVEYAFDAFRHRGRLGGARGVLWAAARWLARLPLDVRGKRDPLRFVIVRAATALEATAQVIRVLARPSLYAHTRQDRYL